MQKVLGGSRQIRWLLAAVVVALLAAGAAMGAEWRAQTVEARMRQALLRQAISVAQAVDPDLVSALTFTASDLGLPAFERLRDQLTAYARTVAARGIYTMMLRDGVLYFGPESYADDDPMASRPGTSYNQPAPESFEVFDTGQPVAFGPFTDEYGTFVSALAPVFDRRSGSVQMVLSIDIMADTWKAAVGAVRWAPWLSALAFVVVSLLWAGAIRWRDRSGTHAAWLMHLETAFVGLMGLALTVMVVLLVRDAEHSRLVDGFTAASVAQVEAVADALRAIQSDVRAVARFHESSQYVDCGEFDTFAGPLVSGAAMEGYRWIPIVRAAERVAFEATAGAEGLEGYRVWVEAASGERISAPDDRTTYPIRCVVPRDGDQAVLGLDVGSEPAQRAVLDAAAGTGLATATDAFPLVHSDDGALGILVVQPVYAPGVSSQPGGLEGSGVAPVGFVAALVRLQSLLELVLMPYVDTGALVNLHLVDLTDDLSVDSHESLLIVAAHPAEFAGQYPVRVDREQEKAREITQAYPILVFGRAFAAVTHATPALYRMFPLRTSPIVGVAGTLLTTLLTLFVGFLRARQTDLEMQVRARTVELREREQNLAITLDSIGDAVIATDTAGRITRLNPVAEQLTGWTHAEALGRPLSVVFRIAATEMGDALEDPVRRALKAGVVTSLAGHTTLIARDGAEHQIADSAAPIRDADGDIVGAVLVFHDVTEQVRMRAALVTSEEKYRRLAEGTAAVLWEYDVITDRWTYVSPQVEALLGYAPDEWVDLQFWIDHLHPEDREWASQYCAACTARGESHIFEYRFLAKDGGIVWLRDVVSVEMHGETSVVLRGFMVDLTEVKRAEEALQRQLGELEALHRASQAIMAAGADPERVYASVHRVVEELMPAEAFVIVLRDPVQGDNDAVYAYDRGGRWPARRSPADQGLSGYVIGRGEAVLMDDSSRHSAFRVARFDSPESVESVLAVPLRVNERVIGMLSAQSYAPAAYTHHDLVLLETLANHVAAGLENIRLFGETREQVQRIQAVLDSVPEGVLLLDADGRILQANPAAVRDLSSVAEIDAGETLVRLGNRPLTELLASLPEGVWHEIESDERIFQVVARPVTGGPEPECYVVVIDDVTRDRQVKTELQRQERLAAVGQLAAGIAHDFNNILAVIVLYAQMDLRAPDLPAHFRAHTQTILDQAQHAAGLVQQILDFGRRAMLEPRPMDLIPFLRQQVALLARTLPESIRIELDLQVARAGILADTTRMQQMITNLAVNARDAMPDGGVLTIESALLVLGEDQAGPLPDMAPGTWVRTTVRDTGSGMTPEVLAHLFEPFFTTKEPGKGTGLGLAQVYGIVKQHHGHIGVESEVGQGTTVTIYLPPAGAVPTQASNVASSLRRGRGEAILVVEDNATVRDAVVSALEMLNYRTVEAADGREALEMLEQRDDEIAAVLSDFVMPEMGGQALLLALEVRGLTLPVIFLSGHPAQEDQYELQSRGLVGWLGKPPELEALAEMLGRALS